MNGFPDQKLKKILDDKTSGSTGLVLKLNRYFSGIASDRNKIRKSLKFIRGEFSHFTVIKNYLADFSKALNKNDEHAVKTFTGQYQKEQSEKYERLYSNAVPYLFKSKTFITLSNSRTLEYIFIRLKKDKHIFKVIAAESRPKLEGRFLAKALLRNNIKVELITDAELSLFVPKADALILGADMILKGGNIVNKTGSKSAALLCGHYKKPVYAISTKDKISNKKSFRPAKMNPSEIWNYSHENLSITNIYFEMIEAELITKLITD